MVILYHERVTICICTPANVSGLKRAGHRLHSEMFFDTLKISCSVAAKDIVERAVQRQINLRVYTEGVVRARTVFLESTVLVV